MHGLASAGDSAVPALIQALENAEGALPGRTAQAAEALGEAVRTPSLDAVAALSRAMVRLRETATMAESGGGIGVQNAVAFCVDALKFGGQRLAAGVEAEAGVASATLRALVGVDRKYTRNPPVFL